MATGAPGTNGVWQYGEDDSEATFSALLNKAASTTDTQIGADRTRLTTLEARKLAGLIPVVPTSVTASSGTGSYNSSGTVTFTGATGITLNGVFTSAYKNYFIDINFTDSSSSTGVYARLASSGTPNSSSIYSYTFIYNSTGAASGLGGVATSNVDIAVIYNNGAAPGNGGTSIDIRNPQQTNYTTATFRGINSRSGTVEQRSGGFHTTVTTSFDGIQFYTGGTTTLSGKINVFGYQG